MKPAVAFAFITLVFGVRQQAFPLTAPPAGIVDTELRPETVAGFDRYVRGTEMRIRKQLDQPDRFLFIDGLSDQRCQSVKSGLRHGGVFMQRLATTDSSGRVITTSAGLIHHWIGDVFISGASVTDVLDVLQDYNSADKTYYPQVVRSQLISSQGNEFDVAMRFREKEMITITLDTEHDVKYAELDSTHWSSSSRSTRIAEVVDAGERDEHDKPVGHGGGFLWRINSYWRFVQSDGGVYVECEAVSLSRDIPTGLGWLIEPFITSIPKDSLHNTLTATRQAVLARIKTEHHAATIPLEPVKTAASVVLLNPQR